MARFPEHSNIEASMLGTFAWTTGYDGNLRGRPGMVINFPLDALLTERARTGSDPYMWLDIRYGTTNALAADRLRINNDVTASIVSQARHPISMTELSYYDPLTSTWGNVRETDTLSNYIGRVDPGPSAEPSTTLWAYLSRSELLTSFSNAMRCLGSVEVDELVGSYRVLYTGTITRADVNSLSWWFSS
jgi:hypothetical protein